MSDLDTFPIRSRLSEVPAPPWCEFSESGDWWIQQRDEEWNPIGESICNSNIDDMTCAVATFIEHAPQDITDLLAEVKRLQEHVLRLTGDLREIYDHPDASQGVRSIAAAGLGI